ncbi:MAG: hypothetical protein LN412_04205, partial [Candidatus Thermoplasmatota archaeon]|nr:hypothetical protein [Candidatus Thermoplasmatota archaeon]
EKAAGEHGDGLQPANRDTEGFFGSRRKTNPGNIKAQSVAGTTNAGGELAASVAIASPGVGRAIRILGFALIGPEMVAASGSFLLVNDGDNIHVGPKSGSNQTSGPWIVVNYLCTEDTEITWELIDGAGNDAYSLTMAFREEDVVA